MHLCKSKLASNKFFFLKILCWTFSKLCVEVFAKQYYCVSLQTGNKNRKMGLKKKIHGSIEKSKYTKMKLSRNLIPRAITHGPGTRTDIGIDHRSQKLSRFSKEKRQDLCSIFSSKLGVLSDFDGRNRYRFECGDHGLRCGVWGLHFGIFRFLFLPMDVFYNSFFRFLLHKRSSLQSYCNVHG